MEWKSLFILAQYTLFVPDVDIYEDVVSLAVKPAPSNEDCFTAQALKFNNPSSTFIPEFIVEVLHDCKCYVHPGGREIN